MFEFFFVLRITKKIKFSISVAYEIDLFTYPNRLGIIAAALWFWDFGHGMIAVLVNPNPAHCASAIMLPLLKPVSYRGVCDLIAVRTVRSPKSIGNVQCCNFSVGNFNGKKLCISIGKGIALRIKQNLLAIWRESPNQVIIRMPGETLWNATRSRHNIHICIAIVLRIESNHTAVWRKNRIRFHAFIHSEPPRIGTIYIGNPKVFGINEGDIGFTDCRLRKQAGVFCVYGQHRAVNQQK